MLKSPKRESFRNLFLIACSFIALSVFAIGLTIVGLRSDAINDAYDDSTNIAAVLSEQLTRSIQAVEIVRP